MPYRIYNKIAFGSLKSICISDVFSEIPTFFTDHCVVMTRRDSDNVVSLGTEFHDKFNIEQRGTGILIPTDTVSSWLEDDWPFDSFEEIFFCKYDDVPDQIDGDRIQFTPNNVWLLDSIPSQFLELFSTLGASRFLSDGWGIGLNYVCEEPLAELIEKLAKSK